MLGFHQLQGRLIATVQERIRSGEITERRLAHRIGISQPHVHNVLKGKRVFSIPALDAVLFELRLDVIDLLTPDDFTKFLSGR
jgi:predicted XRE-type DNA-binding protein